MIWYQHAMTVPKRPCLLDCIIPHFRSFHSGRIWRSLSCFDVILYTRFLFIQSKENTFFQLLANAEWSSWSLERDCYSKDLIGPKVQRYSRTCSAGTCTGNEYYYKYVCHQSCKYIVSNQMFKYVCHKMCKVYPLCSNQSLNIITSMCVTKCVKYNLCVQTKVYT